MSSGSALRLLLACSALALLGFRDPGCGTGGSERAGLNGPCTRTKDCDTSLRCFEGVCVPEEASVPPDAAVKDAAQEASNLDAASEASADAATDATSDGPGE